MATIDVAMESSVQAVKTVADNIYSKVDTEVNSVVTNTATNNTASKTGVLSAKLAYVISLLENTTYGLSAIKSNSGAIKSVQRGTVEMSAYKRDVTISSVNMSKTFVNIQPVLLSGSGDTAYARGGDYYHTIGHLTSATNLELRVGSPTAGQYCWWEVVEYK